MDTIAQTAMREESPTLLACSLRGFARREEGGGGHPHRHRRVQGEQLVLGSLLLLKFYLVGKVNHCAVTPPQCHGKEEEAFGKGYTPLLGIYTRQKIRRGSKNAEAKRDAYADGSICGQTRKRPERGSSVSLSRERTARG